MNRHGYDQVEVIPLEVFGESLYEQDGERVSQVQATIILESDDGLSQFSVVVGCIADFRIGRLR
jgi:hypothetical protein